MFNVGAGELVVILVAALLILGPKRLPELARGLGKFLREFRRQTDEVRTAVEREFYRMDLDLEAKEPAKVPAQHPTHPSTSAPLLGAPAGIQPSVAPAGDAALPPLGAHDAEGRLIIATPFTAAAPLLPDAAPAPIEPASPIANESFRAVPRSVLAAPVPPPPTPSVDAAGTPPAAPPKQD